MKGSTWLVQWLGYALVALGAFVSYSLGSLHVTPDVLFVATLVAALFAVACFFLFAFAIRRFYSGGSSALLEIISGFVGLFASGLLALSVAARFFITALAFIVY